MGQSDVRSRYQPVGVGFGCRSLTDNENLAECTMMTNKTSKSEWIVSNLIASYIQLANTELLEDGIAMLIASRTF
jgi:hypothetical protein